MPYLDFLKSLKRVELNFYQKFQKILTLIFFIVFLINTFMLVQKSIHNTRSKKFTKSFTTSGASLVVGKWTTAVFAILYVDIHPQRYMD